MGIHLIVDGYNMIRSSASLSAAEAEGLEEGREALIERLVAYKRIKPWPITVVFDAGGGTELAERKERIRGISVVWSGMGRIADGVIVRLARKRGAGAVVVTSDRALAREVEMSGATVLSSPEFEDRLEMAYYLDMKGGGVEEETFEPTLSTKKKGPGKRRPKSERRKNKRLKKL